MTTAVLGSRSFMDTTVLTSGNHNFFLILVALNMFTQLSYLFTQ